MCEGTLIKELSDGGGESARYYNIFPHSDEVLIPSHTYLLKQIREQAYRQRILELTTTTPSGSEGDHGLDRMVLRDEQFNDPASPPTAGASADKATQTGAQQDSAAYGAGNINEVLRSAESMMNRTHLRGSPAPQPSPVSLNLINSAGSAIAASSSTTGSRTEYEPSRYSMDSAAQLQNQVGGGGFPETSTTLGPLVVRISSGSGASFATRIPGATPDPGDRRTGCSSSSSSAAAGADQIGESGSSMQNSSTNSMSSRAKALAGRKKRPVWRKTGNNSLLPPRIGSQATSSPSVLAKPSRDVNAMHSLSVGSSGLDSGLDWAMKIARAACRPDADSSTNPQQPRQYGTSQKRDIFHTEHSAQEKHQQQQHPRWSREGVWDGEAMPLVVSADGLIAATAKSQTDTAENSGMANVSASQPESTMKNATESALLETPVSPPRQEAPPSPLALPSQPNTVPASLRGK